MNDIINKDKKEYKKIINKLIKTIENNGIPDKLKKWNKPKIKIKKIQVFKLMLK